MSWQAQAWAWEQERNLSSSEKFVLLALANHANDQGYTWPSIELIASECRQDVKTTRRQIRSLLVRRVIWLAKRRLGSTGQVRVYRLPKSCRVSLPKTVGFKNDAKQDISRAKGGHKPTKNGSVTGNRETVNQNGSGEKEAWDSSLAEGANDLSHSQKKKVLPFSPEPAALPEWVKNVQEMPEFAKRNVEKEARKIRVDAEKRPRPFTKQLLLNCLRKYPHNKGAKRKPAKIKQTCETPDEQPTDDSKRTELHAEVKKQIEALRQQFAFK
jgi:hypothetical protein